MNPLDGLRAAKHRWFLHRKAAAKRADAKAQQRELAWSRAHPYHYDREGDVTYAPGVRCSMSSTMQVNHLDFEPVGNTAPRAEAPAILWAVWAGDNPLTPNRKASWEQIQRVNTDAECILVTPQNLGDFEVAEHPIHPAYEHLSLIHRSDYLRAYLMHHHGGGYVDIKPGEESFRQKLIEPLNADDNLWGIGPEAWPRHTSPAMGPLGEIQDRYVSHILFPAAFAFKPGSSMTEEWMAEVDRRLNYYQDILERHPATDVFGANRDYPVPWVGIMGHVFCPLCLKYSDHLRTIPDSRVVIWNDNYR